MRHPVKFLISALALFALARPAAAEWKPAAGPLMTRWAREVSPQNTLPEYPRPQLARRDWLNLNGLWQFARAAGAEEAPPVGRTLARAILVPFPVESALSGIMERAERVWYRREFTIPAAWKGKRILLHFGAVDWEATVWVNGKRLGVHRGGYDPFTFDLTSALAAAGPQEVVVGVFDPTDHGEQPRGKQVNRPEGIYYTPTTGIWQTVWLEPVPETAIGRLTLTPDVDGQQLQLTAAGDGAAVDPTLSVEAQALDGSRLVGRTRGQPNRPLMVPVPQPKLWSPDRPFLYRLRVRLLRGDRALDEVESYFGMRKVGLVRAGGVQRLALNGKPLFRSGPSTRVTGRTASIPPRPMPRCGPISR